MNESKRQNIDINSTCRNHEIWEMVAGFSLHSPGFSTSFSVHSLQNQKLIFLLIHTFLFIFSGSHQKGVYACVSIERTPNLSILYFMSLRTHKRNMECEVTVYRLIQRYHNHNSSWLGHGTLQCTIEIAKNILYFNARDIFHIARVPRQFKFQ